jgi:hypothetical protein
LIALRAWASHVEGVASGNKQPANVVPLHKAGALT